MLLAILIIMTIHLAQTLQNFTMMVLIIFRTLIDLVVSLEEQEQNLLMPKQI
jgi:hypothetical protein